MQEKEFSTFDLAKICNVAHTTVINWIDQGKLTAHSTPGGHRRVYLPDLLSFLNQFKMRVPQELLEKKHSILIVDDDKDVLAMLKRNMSEYAPEWNVRTATNGVEALVMVGNQPPSVLILDIVMPDIDGIAVCKQLKAGETTKNIDIVAITGKSLQSQEYKYLRENSIIMFKKPFSPQKLIAIIRKHIETHQP